MHIWSQKKEGRVSTLPSPRKCITIITIIAMTACPWKVSFALDEEPRQGVHAVYQVKQTKGSRGNIDLLFSDTITVLENRLTSLGFTEGTVIRDGTDRIQVIIPDLQVDDEILDTLCIPARVEFKDEADNVLIESKDIVSAMPVRLHDTGTYCVALDFTPEGAELLTLATTANLGRVISIEVDDTVISAPVVNAVIGREAIIESPHMTAEEATKLTLLLNSGAMPLRIERIETTAITITPDMTVRNLERVPFDMSAPHRLLSSVIQFVVRFLWQ